jgi:hypothetical protein
MKRTLLALLAPLALAACEGLSTPRVCPGVVQPSVRLTVEDAMSGTNVTPGASVVLRSGAYADSLVAPPGVNSVGVGNRAGTFTLTVRRAGYELWTRTDVRVEAGPCGAATVELTARLNRAPEPA